MPDLAEKITQKSAVIAVIGLGYVGLPAAVGFAEAGFRVIGLDNQKQRVDQVNEGNSFLTDVPNERLRAVLPAMTNTTDTAALADADVVIICVPTPLTRTREPDLTYVVNASKDIANHLRNGQLVVLESTTFPGTTRDHVVPILERSGLKAGRDFHVAYAPERIDPGNTKYTIRTTPKLVAGMDTEATNLVAMVYGAIADTVVPLSCPEAAEMTKIFENIFRSVNIALVNELAQLCHRMKIDVWEVVNAAKTKPFGFMPFQPGPGIGGHCIPLDPYYLAYKAREIDFHTRFIELAAEINETMPYYVRSRIMEALSEQGKSVKNARILVLGVTYKKDVGDTRESPALKLIELLRESGANLSYNDPYVPSITLEGETLYSVTLDDHHLTDTDCVVITTDHSCYDYPKIAARACLVFDTRGTASGLGTGNVETL